MPKGGTRCFFQVRSYCSCSLLLTGSVFSVSVTVSDNDVKRDSMFQVIPSVCQVLPVFLLTGSDFCVVSHGTVFEERGVNGSSPP